MATNADMISRAQGCLLGQLSGDSLGSLVEFMSPEEIRRRHPAGVRRMTAGGVWNLLPGQSTDDSEMALLLARLLLATGRYDPAVAAGRYRYWLETEPFDCGITIASALRGQHVPDSEANGALMRISPLGIFGASHPLEGLAEWARQDAAITHQNLICQEANVLFAMAIAEAIRSGPAPHRLYDMVVTWAEEMAVADALHDAILQASDAPPADFMTH